MTFAVFSLGGLPPFAGMFSKFLIFMAAGSAGHFLLVFIALINTVISLYYYLLIVKTMWIKKGESDAVEHFSSDVYNKISMLICLLGILATGILWGVFSERYF
jgi:NADH-quinone oxidoreductase subunit N